MDELQWAESVSEKIKKKLEITAKRNAHKIPYTTDEGVFDDKSKDQICWWTNGFWGGIMWQMYHATGEKMYFDIAQYNEKELDRNLMNAQGMDHDSGFRWLPTAVCDYRITKDPASKNRGLLAANDLAGRFNSAGSFIRAWNDSGDASKAGWAIIDCMMNLPLLYWAYDETKDPRFIHIATAHANMAEKYFIRPDGSANHIVAFDPVTGDFVKTFGGQGYAEGSSWTRGQGWALYGFVLSYIHTKNESYLNTAKRVANYFIANMGPDALIPVDFRQPEECKLEDSTASAIAACGMLEIEKYVPQNEKHVYHQAAIKLLRVLDEKRCSWDNDCDNILEKCTGAFHDEKHEYSIIYGDYYFIEAIWKLTEQDIFIW
ncbi:glycoside hydrolase family 88 protein [Blautia liquoris]|uniref:Glycoside hydrolase family 88 protein n=1 Tax=Blautia liquoris TaxID=2779518 RepID=A0A7M2RDQ8_9FIRM|nr:glycoside hydrolase family 88 protein [Blautia liquoris]QOV18455.1 glycoside hydrolase family 88 protein [Blautia liquoris]